MKDLSQFEREFAEFLSDYIDPKKAEEKQGDYPLEHDYYRVLEDCEELIKAINKEADK